jgi:exopolysaccharide biosynthesis polyprenyl glycosylphosphotransferase
MLKQQAKFFSRINILTDMAVISAAFMAAHVSQNSFLFQNGLRGDAWLLLIILPTWLLFLSKFGFYASIRTSPITTILANLLKITILGGVITSSTVYFFNPPNYHRELLGWFVLFSFIFLVIEKCLLRVGLGLIRRKGYNFRNLLIVGTPANARNFLSLVEQHMDWGLRVVGILKVPNGPEEFQEDYPILGTMEDLVHVCKDQTVDEVIFCVSRDLHGQLRGCLRDMQEMGITVRLVLDFYESPTAKMDLYLFHGALPMVTFYTKPFDMGDLLVKRAVDVVGATVGLMATAILTPFIALAIKLDSQGPVFFGQKRIGEGGRAFTFWKFRSMEVNADQKKKNLTHLNEMNGAIFKIRNDPRITRVGRHLRKTSLDELPQFWNVLRGEMSLVGTRPPTPDEVANYENWHRKRISIKPGITGLWQVSGRNQVTDFDEVARLDIEYIEKWSLWLDIKILIKTLFVILSRSGSF